MRAALRGGSGPNYHPAMRERFLLAVAAFTTTVVAQCGPVLDQTWGIAGCGPLGTSMVFASCDWDPDGTGPASPRLVVGGRFDVAGRTRCRNIVVVDRATGACTALGAGLPGDVTALAVLPTGDLVAGGVFLLGPVPLPSVMMWDGSAWQPLGAGLSGRPRAMVVAPNGALIVAGAVFWGPVFAGVVQWHAGAWSTIGGTAFGDMNAVAVAANGDLWVGGPTMSHAMRWNGVTWQAMALLGGPVSGLVGLPNGDVVAACGYGGMWRYSGTTALPFGPAGVSGECLAALPNGEVVVGRIGSPGQVMRGNGVGWTTIGTVRQAWGGTVDGPRHLRTLANGEVLMGGLFDEVETTGACNVAIHDGSAWHSLVPGTSHQIEAMAGLANGDTIAAGWFRQIGGVAAAHVARWDGATWHDLGGGTDGPVYAVCALANGELAAAGAFAVAGGVPAAGVARWNGQSWSPLGAGLGGVPHALLEWPGGALLAAGDQLAPPGGAEGLVAFVGGVWATVAPLQGSVRCMLHRPNGELWLGGRFTLPGGQPSPVARWSGGAWSAESFGVGFGTAALAETRSGELIAGGFDNYAHPVWRRAAGTWSPLGSGLGGSVAGFVGLPDGDVLASGGIGLSGVTMGLARWDGTAWTHYGQGNMGIASLLHGDRELWLRGPAEATWSGQPTPFLYRAVASCPPAVVTSGSGCGVGAGPAMTIVGSGGPWRGGTWRTTASGAPPQAPVLAVYGLASASWWLGVVLPQSGAACTLLASPDLVLVPAQGGGTVTPSLAIPDLVNTVGLTLHHQVVACVAGPGPGLGAAASPALVATIGTW